ncbi:MAG: response regulator [Planctomycetia bacterium]|nr:response regulator [Planctomycetia bacterium]
MMTATHTEERPDPVEPAPPGVLVVDDEPAIRQLLQMSLEVQGFQVWAAAGGAEAVELYRAQRAAIGVVLLDVIMPGLDGPRTLQALEACDPEVCCLFMSGNLGDYSEQELLRRGARGLVRKPFVLEDLATRLRRLATR